VGQNRQEAIVVGVSNPHHIPFKQYNDQLLDLGLQLKDCANEEWGHKRLDICILSLDLIQAPPPEVVSNLEVYDIPFIVSLNAQASVSSITGYMQRAVGFLFGEPSLQQLALEIELGLHLHRERKIYSKRVEHVATKIQNNRDIGVATGLLMAQTHLSSLEVFEVMKAFSRNGRIRISTVAEQIIKLYEHEHPDLATTIKIDDLGRWLADQLNASSNDE
jgi:hypothetical protein